MDEQNDDELQASLTGWARIVNHQQGGGWDHGPVEGQVVSIGDPQRSLDWQFRRGRWHRLVQGRL